MRTAQGQPVRLEDYRVPDFLVDTVDLDISLDREATRVVATLAMRPHPQGRPDAALELDGDELELVAAALDGATLAPGAYKASPSGFVLPDPPRRPFTLRFETRLNPAANTKLMGLYRSGSAYCTQCEAEGFRRITYFPDRPDVLSTYRVRLEADKAEAPVLLANGNLESAGEAEGGRHWAVWRDPFKKPCYLFAARRRRSRPRRRRLRHHVGATRRARRLCRARPRGARRLRDGRAEAGDGVGRARLRPRIRPRLLQHRRRLRLQYGGDGEQGAQRLQRQIRAGVAADGDRRRLRRHRGRHRPRVLPQLDRQPHHLPRLVPALPEGGADRLSRPGILRRPALGAGQAHRRRARAARRAIRRGRRPARPSGAAVGLSRDQQLLHRDGLSEGRRGHPHAASADRRRGVPRRHGSLFRALRRHGGDGRGFPRLLRRGLGPRSRRISSSGIRRPARRF